MKLSIIIAAYNCEKYIKRCIYSCINQNYNIQNYEIIVIDDGSTDKTLSILNQLQKKVANLIVISQKNKGLGASRNIGIKYSQGTYLWFIDGDDYIATDVLDSIVRKIELEKLDVLALDYSIVDEEYNQISKNNSSFRIDSNIVSGSCFYKDNYLQSYTWLFLFKKKLFTENNIFFKEKINMQDSEILPKLLIHSKKVALYNTVCYYYVQHQNSFTNTSNGEKRYKYFKSIISVKESLEYFLHTVKNDKDMAEGLKRKINAIDEVVFNHLIFYSYEKEWFVKCIDLLKKNYFFPLKFTPKGKFIFLKYGMNNFPVLTKNIIDIYFKLKDKK